MKRPHVPSATRAARWGLVNLGLVAGAAFADAGLTSMEKTWLTAASPVIQSSLDAGLPLDVVVQPKQANGESPVALAYIDGRCKLVLTMCGNAEAHASLDRMAQAFKELGVDEVLGKTAAIQLMAAHEIYGHCARHVAGAWEQAPPGYPMRPPEQLSEGLQKVWVQTRATRLEEGYADLAGLEWTRKHSAELYPSIHAWLVKERSRDLVQGGHHDTLAWIHAAAPSTHPVTARGAQSETVPVATDWSVVNLWQSTMRRGP